MYKITPPPLSDTQQWPGLGNLRHLPTTWHERRTAFQNEREHDRDSVCFFGDSITEGWGPRLAEWFRPLKTFNRGISGDTTRGMIFRLQEDVLSSPPSELVIMAGVNDLDVGSHPAAIASNLMQLVEMCKDYIQPDGIFICEILPHKDQLTRPELKIRSANEHIRNSCSLYKCGFIPTYQMFLDPDTREFDEHYFKDVVHLNDRGYRLLSNIINTRLREVIFP